MHLKVFRYYAITSKKLKSLHYQGLAALMPVNTKSNGFSGFIVIYLDRILFAALRARR